MDMSILPSDGSRDNRIVPLEQRAYEEIQQAIQNTHDEFLDDTCDEFLDDKFPEVMWEIARVAIKADRKATQRAIRRENGDYGPELDKAIALAETLSFNTDGDAYNPVFDLLTVLKRARSGDLNVESVKGINARVNVGLTRLLNVASDLQAAIKDLED